MAPGTTRYESLLGLNRNDVPSPDVQRFRRARDGCAPRTRSAATNNGLPTPDAGDAPRPRRARLRAPSAACPAASELRRRPAGASRGGPCGRRRGVRPLGPAGPAPSCPLLGHDPGPDTRSGSHSTYGPPRSTQAPILPQSPSTRRRLRFVGICTEGSTTPARRVFATVDREAARQWGGGCRHNARRSPWGRPERISDPRAITSGGIADELGVRERQVAAAGRASRRRKPRCPHRPLTARKSPRCSDDAPAAHARGTVEIPA